MGSQGGGGSGDSRSEVRYAPYVEDHHTTFLSTIATRVSSVIDNSPFSGWTDVDLTDAFFGSGYTIASFPSLYDMYGKFMAGLDVDVLYTQIYEDTVNSPAINELVSAEADLLDDDITANVIPRFEVGMRDINSVMSSSFVVGKSLIEDARVKSVAKFSAGLKYQMIPVVSDRWKAHLDWNKGVTLTYAEIIKLYYSAYMDTKDMNYSMQAKNSLWPFTVLEFQRAAIGALQGAVTTQTDVAGSSRGAKAISGALTGAALGGTIGSAVLTGTTLGMSGGVIGAAAGAVVGLAAGLLM